MNNFESDAIKLSVLTYASIEMSFRNLRSLAALYRRF